MLKKTAIILLLTIASARVCAQIGGESTYNFLKVNPSAKSAALGGVSLSPMYNDVGMVTQNPALLDSGMHRDISLTYLHYVAGISHSSLAGAWHQKGVGTLGLSFVSLNYGSFDGYDEEGADMGTFNANEFDLGLHYSRNVWRNVSLGATLNTIISQLERYNSFGMALNVGARYHSHNNLFNATLALKNIGYQLKPYTEGNHEKLPFEIQLSMAQKFENAPFGISLSLNDLQSFNTYTNTEESQTSLDGREQQESGLTKAGKELLSHVAVGVEIIPSKYFFIMGGYNFRRGNELKVGEKSGGTGFSFGLGLRLKYVELNYAHAIYHLGGANNHFGLILRIF